MIWFTSDLHLGHEKIIGYAHRPFPDAEAMGAAIVRALNERVGRDDTLWVLGDVCMGRDKPRSCASLLSRLSCRDVRLVRGNHDPHDREALLAAGFSQVEDLVEIGLGGKQRAVLCHYPLLSWSRMRHGSWMLHGHIHSEGMAHNEGERAAGMARYDVGVDANGFAPVSADELGAFLRGTQGER